MMWFRRPEFDRYARFKSHGSAREIFSWDEMQDVMLPIPSIDKQREIVAEYNTMNTISKLNPSTEDLLKLMLDYKYQPTLTEKLDNSTSDFDQELINEIVLWKTNRYAEVCPETLKLINKIDRESNLIDLDQTREILKDLLKTHGIRLPMASTILRFRNPNIYQIIDQRVYRVIYGEELKPKTNTDDSIEQYLNYLTVLRNTAEQLNIPFQESDRILYEYDKKVNPKSIKY
jgi:thermostable 8-oxoguanine DNA glycosylase